MRVITPYSRMVKKGGVQRGKAPLPVRLRRMRVSLRY